jgi:hypothetical protein
MRLALKERLSAIFHVRLFALINSYKFRPTMARTPYAHSLSECPSIVTSGIFEQFIRVSELEGSCIDVEDWRGDGSGGVVTRTAS